MSMNPGETVHEKELSDVADVDDLHHFGYQQSLKRVLGPYGSFAIAFSMISITTGIFFLLPSLFGTSGGVGVALWLPCAAGVFLIVMVYSHLAARIPITGFAYQWNSRLISPHYGWFTGYTALVAFIAGATATAAALASVFVPDIWKSPTHTDTVVFVCVTLAAAAVINILSIKAVSAFNNWGVFFEIAGSVIAALMLIIGTMFFFKHDVGFSVLTSTVRTNHSSLWYGIVLSSLLPLYTFIGWEGAADLSEETLDPRATTPTAMIRANYVSVLASAIMIIGFLIAIPKGITAMLGQNKNDLVYIFQYQFGQVASVILQVIVFIAIFSCVLANMVVATRLCFALARDKMLPASGILGKVNDSTATPIASILLVLAVGIGINLLSAGITANVISIVSVAYYMIYLLTVGGAIYAYLKKKIPGRARATDFSLGRWFLPIAVVAILYVSAVIVVALAPQEGHVAGEYLLYTVLVGTAWYVFYLRGRINRQLAGVYRAEVTELEKLADA